MDHNLTNGTFVYQDQSAEAMWNVAHGTVSPHELVPAFLFFNTIQKAPPPVCLSPNCGSDMTEDMITPMLQYYGFGGVSTRNILREIARRASLKMNSSELVKHMTEKMGSIFRDQVHPWDLGKVLFTDLLMLHFLKTLGEFTYHSEA